MLLMLIACYCIDISNGCETSQRETVDCSRSISPSWCSIQRHLCHNQRQTCLIRLRVPHLLPVLHTASLIWLISDHAGWLPSVAVSLSDSRWKPPRATTTFHCAPNVCCGADKYSVHGDRAIAAAGPGLWNSLPSNLK